ncbi:NAD(P)/FAD-dependent oxidoreductase [Pararhizobium gei]|uniref:NAD(P)/FAD-dependent oxidoreductase n=1 Tax=Pararhizobium gei TaxID=1395951 RepID=UPI0023DB5F9E|nr:FAD-binding oxidoreductase [Rhizobium gei]
MSDVLIVGGGIMGLWAAIMADRAGLKTRLVERDVLGAGASGGVLGALMPYMPDRWDEKKQFQFDALVSLEAEIASLEAETGLPAGYRRCGRLMPLAKPHLREIALRHEKDALVNWRSGASQFHWHVREKLPDEDWLAPAAAASGIVHDTLAARVSPRRLIALLAARLRQSSNVRIEQGRVLIGLDPATGRAEFADGRSETFDQCVLANGVQAFRLIDRFVTTPVASGTGVKGQAALLRLDAIDPALPIIFTDGVYVVPHENGLVAIGSTSENTFDKPFTTDEQLDMLLARAADLAPLVRKAQIVERWAGIRPKAAGRDPMVGRHPRHGNLHILAGGFKTTFGIAHRLAAAVIGEMGGKVDQALPDSFRCQSHVAQLETPV